MDFIISGGLGFIGKNLSLALSKTDNDFQVLDKLTGCDVCDAFITPSECRTFVHLAAFTNVRESILNPGKTITQNNDGIVNCLEYAKEVKAHFIFTSSMGAPKALSPYSASKLAGEAFCNAYRESYGLETTILRLSNVYGPHSKHKNSIVAKFIKLCLDKKDIEIYGNGLQTRDFIHVDDVVRTIIKEPKAKMFNVASGTATTVLEVTEIIRDLSRKLTNFTPEIKWKEFVKGEITDVEIKTSIKASIKLETGLESTFKWFLEHY